MRVLKHVLSGTPAFDKHFWRELRVRHLGPVGGERRGTKMGHEDDLRNRAVEGE